MPGTLIKFDKDSLTFMFFIDNNYLEVDYNFRSEIENSFAVISEEN